MSIVYCDKCGAHVDTDYDVDHDVECEGTVIESLAGLVTELNKKLPESFKKRVREFINANNVQRNNEGE